MIFEPLTADDLQLMHDQTLKILAETGAIVEGKEAREILLSAGCQDDGKRLRFPSK
ncbi:MAG: trimethylamine methyltransferase family protein, partial [Dethiobacteria bacterium]